MQVVIGIDPHKVSHTAVAIDGSEDQISSVKVRATRRQVDQLVAWAEPFEKRTWAIESAGGLGYLLAQQLVAQGEEVLDVPATLASRIRVLATGRSNKNDPNDALSIAIAAFRASNLRSVEVADHSEVLRLLAKRNGDLGSHRTRVVCRLHALLAELAPGGISKEFTFLTPSGCWRRSRPRPRPSRSVTTLPSSSSMTSDALTTRPKSRTAGFESPSRHRARRSPNSMEWARSLRHNSSATPATSAALPTATPLPPTTAQLRSSSPQVGGRASPVTTRKPTAQPRPSHGGHLSDPPERVGGSDVFRPQGCRGQDEEGSGQILEAPGEQRCVPTAGARRPIGGPGGHSGTTHCLRDRLFTLRDRLFGEVTPEPIETLRRRVLPRRLDSSRLEVPEIGVLTQRGFVR